MGIVHIQSVQQQMISTTSEMAIAKVELELPPFDRLFSLLNFTQSSNNKKNHRYHFFDIKVRGTGYLSHPLTLFIQGTQMQKTKESLTRTCRQVSNHRSIPSNPFSKCCSPTSGLRYAPQDWSDFKSQSESSVCKNTWAQASACETAVTRTPSLFAKRRKLT